MYLNFITFFSIFSLLFIFFCRRNNFFVDYKLEKHKRFSSKFKSNSIGGILLAIFFIYYYSLKQIDYIFLTFLISILVIGIMSDIKKLNNVGLRFFLQLILIIFFIKILGLEIRTTKIDFIDTILSNTYVNILFVTFCLMVLINGGNFIDGLNGLLLKYYLLIFVLIFLNFNHYQTIDENFLINLIFVLIILLLFNSFGFIYMGDAGAYVLSLFVGIYLIDFSFDNTFISPYFVILLLGPLMPRAHGGLNSQRMQSSVSR